MWDVHQFFPCRKQEWRGAQLNSLMPDFRIAAHQEALWSQFPRQEYKLLSL